MPETLSEPPNTSPDTPQPVEVLPPSPSPIRRRSIANLGTFLDPRDRIGYSGQDTPASISAARREAPNQVAAPDFDTAEGQRVEAQHDAEVRYTDVELLGKSFRVRRNVQEAGNQAVKGWSRVWAAIRNTPDVPRKAIKQVAYSIAQSSYNRKASRLKNAHGQSTLLVQHRETVLSQAERNLDAKKRAVEEYNTRMEARVQTVHEKASQRRQEYLETKRIALENKLARKAVRGQLRNEGASRREVRDILAEVPKEHFDRIGKVAVTAEASRAMRDKAERVQSKAVKAQGKNQQRIETTSGRVERYDTAATQAGEIADNLASMLPFAESYVTVLQEKLAGMTEDNADYSHLTTELQVAEERLAVRQREFAYWQGVSERKRGKAGKATARVENLKEDRDRHASAVRHSATEVDAQHITHSLDNLQLDAEVHVALNPKKKTRKAA